MGGRELVASQKARVQKRSQQRLKVRRKQMKKYNKKLAYIFSYPEYNKNNYKAYKERKANYLRIQLYSKKCPK